MRVLGALMLSFAGLAAAPVRAENVRERLNKIFYWNLSDDLNLTPQQEKSMVVIIEDIQKRRQASLAARDESLEALKKIKKGSGAPAAEKELTRYREAVAKLAGLDAEEYDRLKALFGAETLARYYVVREEVLGRVRDALKSAEDHKK